MISKVGNYDISLSLVFICCSQKYLKTNFSLLAKWSKHDCKNRNLEDCKYENPCLHKLLRSGMVNFMMVVRNLYIGQLNTKS